MTLLQFSIGALNDLRDRHADSRAKPDKPIPAGRVSVGGARIVTVLGAALGLVLAAASGLAVLVLAVLVLGIGYGYDLALKGTAWSWLPFAVGIPLLPVYGWLGAVGVLPPAFLVLVPVGVLEGAALAVANALVDEERDRAAGVSSIATALGRGASGALVVVLQSVVVVVAVAAALVAGLPVGWLALVLGSGTVVVGGALVAAPAGAAPRTRSAAWTVQAAGAAALVVSWLGGLAASGAA